MILCQLTDADIYRNISPLIATAIDWLRTHEAQDFIVGETIILETDKGAVTAKGEETPLMPREYVSLEAHRKYIDIHMPVKGDETIGWGPTLYLKHPREEYNPETDIQFFGDVAHSILDVKVGQIAIFFPEDAHAPNIGLGNHRKYIIKIPV